ncbi:hypothetical protein CABS03_11192 [Colletotrichum abscissum]|uniref:Uncharacterized protein n=1 Tax=Colletotrichum abscissum TaxID=1671311 RepID=A0A9Q0B1E0_9PEZI|nr:hypothetical protein CABS02_10247 [Colletotrichum abscissum]
MDPLDLGPCQARVMNRKSAREQTITSRGVNSWDRQG